MTVLGCAVLCCGLCGVFAAVFSSVRRPTTTLAVIEGLAACWISAYEYADAGSTKLRRELARRRTRLVLPQASDGTRTEPSHTPLWTAGLLRGPQRRPLDHVLVDPSAAKVEAGLHISSLRGSPRPFPDRTRARTGRCPSAGSPRRPARVEQRYPAWTLASSRGRRAHPRQLDQGNRHRLGPPPAVDARR